MKKILEYVGIFYREEFRWAYFIYIGVILTVVIALNYGLDFERRFVQNDNRLIMTGTYWLLYAVPLALSLLGRVWFQGEKEILRNGRLWGLCAFAVLPIALDASTNLRFHEVVRLFDVHLHLSLWIAKCLNNFIEFLILFVPAAIYWYIADRRVMPLYGVSKKNFELWPYFLMLLFMVPLIFWASFQADFLASYPRYSTKYAAYYLKINPVYPILVFEFFYGLAFLSVEFFYRGFFVLALGRYLGKGAVMPMVVIYCMIHFQKPLLESVSSIFGGLLLGIIVFYGRSIYGGIIAHLGVAWMMEAAAFAQIYLFGNKPPAS